MGSPTFVSSLKTYPSIFLIQQKLTKLQLLFSHVEIWASYNDILRNTYSILANSFLEIGRISPIKVIYFI